jgi:hypothetical protein
LIVQRGDVAREGGQQRTRGGAFENDGGFRTRVQCAQNVSRFGLGAGEQRHALLHGAHGEGGVNDKNDARGGLGAQGRPGRLEKRTGEEQGQRQHGQRADGQQQDGAQAMDRLLARAGLQQELKGREGDAARPGAREQVDQHRQPDRGQAGQHPWIGKGRPVHRVFSRAKKQLRRNRQGSSDVLARYQSLPRA